MPLLSVVVVEKGFVQTVRRADRQVGAKRIGGEAGIRTLGTGFGPYNGLANRRLQPLGHLTVMIFLTISALRR
jgi:hypothetical protein